MELNRRHALALGIGAFGAGFGLASQRDNDAGRSFLEEDDVDALVAVATVVYPSTIDDPRAIVVPYTTTLHHSRRRGITSAIDALDQHSRSIHGRSFASFDRPQREAMLQQLGVHRVQPNAAGTVPERIRAYLVNGVLYALFTSPIGTGLLGIENPLGYPGGVDSALGVEP